MHLTVAESVFLNKLFFGNSLPLYWVVFELWSSSRTSSNSFVLWPMYVLKVYVFLINSTAF